MTWGPFDLTGQSVIVTGSAMGIGFGIAARCREAGASVFVADIDIDAAAKAVSRLEAIVSPGKLAYAHADISNSRSAEDVVAKCVADLGAVNVLVNNAGIYPIMPIADVNPDIVDRIMRVNVHGVLYMTKAFAAQVQRQGTGGAIVNIASMDAFHPSFIGLSTYGASKGAVVTLTKHTALELSPLKIRVNAIAPGAIMTEGAAKTSEGGGLTEADRQAIADAMIAKIPVGRMGEPDDIARVAVFLASPAAAYVTGQTIVADGGILLS
jgi:2-dehydro-3-deoxy-D-gluconate 5-dehydrogenase